MTFALLRPTTGRSRSIAVLILIVIASLLLAGCSKSESEAISGEYSDLNGGTSSSGKEYLDVNLPEDNVFTTASDDELLDLLENGTGAVYFGFPQCPWCRNAVPVMEEAAKSVHLDSITYLNVHDIRDEKRLDEAGNVVTDEPGSELYQKILGILGDNAPEYEGLNDPAQRRIYVPLVVVVVDGEITGTHLSTVDSQEDPYVPLTPEQHDELLKTYQDLFSALPGCGVDRC
ncbi:hypothetical protein [Corynebacterium pacaense]|uniref:hypothetical protein n=1 Tax=Corynebacterium pacaense TaxID=1816684 RepID=UPI001177F57A|nr:hypothetical protein [Corynebacterium pacaense]